MPRRGLWPAPDRSTRVALMVIVIAALSLADLAMTLIHVRGIGMLEGNPLARLVMRSGSVEGVVAWKLATAGLGCAILLTMRRHRCAELGAGVCVGVLAWLTVQWSSYNDAAHMLTPQLEDVRADPGTHWVALEPAPRTTPGW